MTFDEYRTNYWRMFLVLEKELVETLDYVELNTNNYATTSIVFSKLLLSIGAEIDNVFRECSGLTGRSNIEHYYKSITKTSHTILVRCYMEFYNKQNIIAKCLVVTQSRFTTNFTTNSTQ